MANEAAVMNEEIEMGAFQIIAAVGTARSCYIEAIHAAKQLPEFDPAKGGQSLYRDAFHMHLVYGRYLLACVWFKTLLGRTPVGNNFMPDDVKEGETVNTDLLVKLQKIGGAYYEA